MSYDSYTVIKVDVAEGVATITMNRPERLNAFNVEMQRELADAWKRLDADKNVRAMVITGAGRAFSAGGDIKIMGEANQDPEMMEEFMLGGPGTSRNVMAITKPIIAAVNGHAVGVACTMALLCDIVIASENARIGDPHVKLGIVAGDGGALIWPLRVGIGLAKRYLLTGDLVPAPEAARIGLIEQVVPEGQAYPVALELAKRLAQGAPVAIKWTKFAINQWMRTMIPAVFDTAAAWEWVSISTQDYKEAASAFLEKRTPNFQGR